jgi:polyhydroxybutyrate depolymerase
MHESRCDGLRVKSKFMFPLVVALALAACGGSSAPVLPDAASTLLGGDRPTELQVPPGIVAGKTYPLVVILHGYGASGILQQVYLGMRDLAKDRGVFVLAPDGMVDANGKQFWNADPACCDFAKTGVDDVAYIGGLIDTVMKQWPIDPKRVIVIGHSNGAFMAYRMACDRADVVTAFVGLAGAAASTPASCAPSRPVALLHLHGTADDTIMYAGGPVAPGVNAPGAIASVAQWAGYLGCTGVRSDTGTLDLVTELAGAETTTSSTAGCPAGGAADLWTITGAGHLPTFAPSFQPALWAWLDAHVRP